MIYRKETYLALSLQQLIFIMYLVINIFVFYLSVFQGNEGVSIKLFGGGDDGYFYLQQARNVMNNQPWVKTSIYPYLVGQIFKLVGNDSALIFRIINLIGFQLLVMTVTSLIDKIYLYSSYRNKTNIHSKIFIFIFIMLYLSLIMQVNLSIYRDVWIYFLYIWSVNMSIDIFYKKKSLMRVLLLLLVLFLLGEFRKYALLSFILTNLLFYISKFFKNPLSKVSFLLFISCIFGVYFLFFKDLRIPIVDLSLTDVLRFRESYLGVNAGGSQMFINLNQSNFFFFILNYIYSFTSNFIGPLPWQVYNFSTLLVFIFETIPFIITLALLYIYKNRLTYLHKYILLHSFIWISLISLSNDNIGTSTRLRPIAWLLIMCVLSFLLFQKRNHHNSDKLFFLGGQNEQSK